MPSSPSNAVVFTASSSCVVSIFVSCLNKFEECGFIAFLCLAALDTSGGGVDIFEARPTGSL